MIEFRPSIFLGAKEEQQAPEESISWMNNNNNNNNNKNNNNNDNERAKVVDQEETREEPHSSRSLGRSDSRDLPAEAAIDLGMAWAGKSSAPPPSSLPNWQFSIHKLPGHSIPNQDSEVGRPMFSLPGPETRPRMRICFDPEHEIPKLQQWFQLNNHPSRLQV